MKARYRLLPLLAISASFTTAATNQYWNVNGTGGDGIWGLNPGEKNWNLTAEAALGNTAWPDTVNDVAVFRDTIGGTVAVFEPLQAAGLIQSGANYTIDASTITLANAASPPAPFINVQTGTLTINSLLAGTTGLTKTGGGTLVLANANPLTGTTLIDAGTLNLTGSLASADVRIASGATLTDATGGLAATAALTNAGTLTVHAADTLTSLTNTAGTVAGTGALTVTGATVFTGGTLAAPLALTGTGGGTFTNATLAGTFTGTTALDGATLSGTVIGNTTSIGSTLVSGSLGGGSLEVNGGILTLTGTSTNPTVTLAAGSGLVDQAGGLDTATVLTNAGTLTVNAADSLASYTQHPTGTLAGTGTLTTSTATLHGGTLSGHLLGTTTSTGDLLVSGSLGGGSLDVTGGILTLTGTSTNATVTLATAAGLIDQNGGLDSATVLTNAGTLTVNAADTIASYTQHPTGTLAGTGTLTTSTATLHGGTLSGHLLGTTTSTGDLLVSGSLGGGSLDVTGGILTLTGTSTNATVTLAAGSGLVDQSGGLDTATNLTNRGALTINAADAIASLTNIAGTVNGSGPLNVTGPTTFTGGTLAAPLTITGNGGGTFTNATLAGTFNGTNTLDTTTVSGTVSGDTTVTGNVLLSGSSGGGSLNLTGGILTLTGTSTNASVTLAAGTGLIDQSGGLAAHAGVINRGTLTVNAADTIATYTQHTTGILEGTGVLTTTTATLSGGTVSGKLAATTLTSNGPVALSGSATAGTIGLTSGTLTNTGTLTATTLLNLAAGSRLVASGSQSYPLLITTGTGAATWQGNLTNPTTVAPGGTGSVGHLVVTGNFTNAPSGGLKLDVASGLSDRVTVGGTATFGGSLDLKQTGAITPFVPIQLVAAGSYLGNFTTLTENLDGSSWFNPANGTLTTLTAPPAAGKSLWGASANQSAAWLSLYDDVIAPGTTNVIQTPDGYQLTSGIASNSNPDLLNTLAASITPSGLNAPLLNRLTPEVYRGFQDYAIQATRSHQRTALDAPTLGFLHAHPGAKDSKHALPDPSALDLWEFFAAVDYFDAATDYSLNQADYDFNGIGFVAGARTTLTERVRVGAYLAGDDGSLDGTLINADASSWSLGVFAKALLEERTHTLLTAGFSYGKSSFDGTRGSLTATGGGWSPANSSFSNVDGNALEFFAGVSTLAYHTDRFRLIPAIGVRYVAGAMDAFSESQAAGPGAPIALAVDANNYHSALAELSLQAEADLTTRLTLHGQLGFNASLTGQSPEVLSARFAAGSRPFNASAAGLDDDTFFLGIGATYRITDAIGVGLHWRGDFRSDADLQNSVGLATSFRF